MSPQKKITRLSRSLLWAAVWFWICSLALYGQDLVSSYAQPNLIKTIQIIPPSQSLAFPFWVDQTASLSISLSSLIKNLRIQLVDPNGVILVFGQPPTATFYSSIYPDPLTVLDAPGANYYLNVEAPTKGRWSLAITIPSALASLASIPVHINYNNHVAPVLFGGGGSVALGSNISFGMAVLDGTDKVGDLQITATLSRLDDPNVTPVLVTFADDGQGADYAIRDSIYSVYVIPSQPGRYVLQIEVSGDASTGHFQRSIASGFKIVPRSASITGNFTVKPRVGVPK